MKRRYALPYVLLRYCSHGCVPRGIFVRIKHETPELYDAKLRFFAISVHCGTCYCSQHAGYSLLTVCI